MISSLMDHANWLVERFRPVRPLAPHEAFQFRFLVGGTLLGLAVTVFSAVVEAFTGPWLSALNITAFGAGLLGLLIGVRAGVSMPTLSWICLLLLGMFLLSNSLLMAEFHESQLRWLVLLPMVSMVLAGPGRTRGKIAPPTRAVGIAAFMAIILGVIIVAAHRFGWTAGIPEPPSTPTATLLGAINDYVLFVISVAGMLWVYGNALHKSEEELRLLQRMLSVCAWCKRIHDAEAGWISLERHLVKNSATELSHGICPDCARIEFPGQTKHPSRLD